MEKKSISRMILLWVQMIVSARILLFTLPVIISAYAEQQISSVSYPSTLILYLAVIAGAHFLAAIFSILGKKLGTVLQYASSVLTWILTIAWVGTVIASENTPSFVDLIPALLSTGITLGVIFFTIPAKAGQGGRMEQQKRQSILIVDDDAMLLKTVRPILISSGYSVLTAESGEDGIQVATSQLPDLIILDVILPGIKGRDVCKNLKQNSQTKHIPIIFLTAKDSPDDINAEIAMGAIAHLTKPVDPKMLLSTVRDVFDK